jgi:hypothetical protein
MLACTDMIRNSLNYVTVSSTVGKRSTLQFRRIHRNSRHADITTHTPSTATEKILLSLSREINTYTST